LRQINEGGRNELEPDFADGKSGSTPFFPTPF
jgi:hypothetical protein